MSDVSWMKRFEVAGFGLTPQAGLLLTSEKFNDYYYGISQAESARSGLAAYGPTRASRRTSGLSATIASRRASASTRKARCACSPTKSRIVPWSTGSVAYGFGAGVSYHF